MKLMGVRLKRTEKIARWAGGLVGVISGECAGIPGTDLRRRYSPGLFIATVGQAQVLRVSLCTRDSAVGVRHVILQPQQKKRAYNSRNELNSGDTSTLLRQERREPKSHPESRCSLPASGAYTRPRQGVPGDRGEKNIWYCK
jgi:hypothetical protein